MNFEVGVGDGHGSECGLLDGNGHGCGWPDNLVGLTGEGDGNGRRGWSPNWQGWHTVIGHGNGDGWSDDDHIRADDPRVHDERLSS